MTQTQRLDVRELINANPLSRFQKLVVFLGFCVIALDGFDIAIMGFIAPTLKQEWGVSNHELGFVISAALIGLALGAIFSGPLADWLGRKKIIINSVFNRDTNVAVAIFVPTDLLDQLTGAHP